MTPGTNWRRSIFGAVDLRTGRFLYLVARRAVSATFTAFLEQLLATYPAAPMVAVVCDNVIIHRSKIVQQWLATTPACGCCMGALQPARQPGRADLGRAQGFAGERTDAHRSRTHPPGARVLPCSRPRRDPGHRRAAQLTMAARRLHAELQAGRLVGTPGHSVVIPPDATRPVRSALAGRLTRPELQGQHAPVRPGRPVLP